MPPQSAPSPSPTPYTSLGVIGAGAWGTALALVAAQAGRKTLLWAREPDVVADIQRRRENHAFLPGVALPASIEGTGALAEAAMAEALLLVVPAQHLRAVLADLGPR